MTKSNVNGTLSSAAITVAAASVCILAPYLEGALPPSVFIAALVTVCLAGAARIFTRERTSLFLKKLLVSISVAALTLCAADLALRPFIRLKRPQTRPPVNRQTSNRAPNKAGVVLDQIEPGDLAYMGHMSRFQESKRVVTKLDRFGYRNNEPLDPNQVYDAIVVGDSFGYGQGTTQEKIWARLLETRYGLKTYNLSKNGGDPWDEYLTLSAEIGRLKTRPGTTVIWALFSGNDLAEIAAYDDIPKSTTHPRLMSLRRFRDYSPLRLLSHHAFQQLFGTSRGDHRPVGAERHLLIDINAEDNYIAKDFINGRKLLFFKPYLNIASCPYEEIVISPTFEKLESAMAFMKLLTDNRKLSLKIILIPSKEEVYSWVLRGSAPWTSRRAPGGLSRALAESAHKQRIDYLDSKPFFLDASKKEYEKTGRPLWWYDDTHVNEQGHALIAEIVHDKLIPRKASEKTPVRP